MLPDDDDDDDDDDRAVNKQSPTAYPYVAIFELGFPFAHSFLSAFLV